jgi:hypothetical protein
MPPVPSACQPLADRVSELEQQYAAAAGQAAASTGAQAWTALAHAGPLLQQLDDARADLDACVKTHSAAVTATVAVIDAGGGPAVGPQSATLWDLSGSTPLAAETVVIQDGAFGFAGPLPAAAAVSLAPDRSADTSLIGVDFRSGTLPQPLTSAQPHLELVLAPPLTISARKLREWAAAFSATPQSLGNVGAIVGSVSALLTTPALTVAPGVVRVDLTGTVSRAGGGLLGLPATLPFAASVALTITPATDPSATELVAVALAGQNPITLSVPGVDPIVQTILPLLTPFVGDAIRTSVAVWINQLAPAAIARSLALPSLPEGTQLSLTRITVDETGITVQPVLGALGPSLSTFQPTPLASSGAG